MPKKKPSPKKGKRQPRYDWKKIRIAREVGGKGFAALSKEFGADTGTIRRRSAREKWLDPGAIAAKCSAKLAEKNLSGLVAQEAKALFANRRRHAEISEKILKWTGKQVAGIADGTVIVPIDTSPVLEMRRLSLILNTLEGTDSRIAGLSKAGDDFRSEAGGGDSDSSAATDRVLEALRGLKG